MKRPWQIWLSFTTALALVAAAVGWLSLRALESDKAEAAGREQALVEENVRLALWRMDSLMAAFVAQALDVSIENVQTTVLGGHGDEMAVDLKVVAQLAAVV